MTAIRQGRKAVSKLYMGTTQLSSVWYQGVQIPIGGGIPPAPPPPPPPSGHVWPANPATLVSVLTNNAQPGDTVELDSGTYGAFAFKNIVKAAPGVMIQPAEDATVVATAGWSWSGCAGLTVQGIEWAISTGRCVTIQLCSKILIYGNDMHGPTVSPRGNNGCAGFRIQGSDQISIAANEIHDLAKGGDHIFGTRDNTNITLDANDVHDLYGDGFAGGCKQFLTISRNTFTNMRRAASAHVDCIQLGSPWSWLHSEPQDGLIYRNVYKIGDGDPVQFIFNGNENASFLYRRYRWIENASVGSQWNAIAIGKADAPEVTHNFTQAMANAWLDPNDHSKGIYTPWQQFRNCVGGTSTNNVMCRGLSLVTNTPNPTQSGNTTTLPVAAAGDYAAIDAFIAGLAP